MANRAPAFIRENALLFAACCIDPETRAVETNGMDWNYLVSAADRQGVAPLLHVWLTRRQPNAVPEAAARDLYHRYWTNHFRNKRLAAELDRVSSAAAETAVQIMPLKGSVLARDYYPTPVLRPMSDLDFLVRPQQLAWTGRLLCDLGYTELAPIPSYVNERSLDGASRERQWTIMKDGFAVLVEFRAEPLEPAVGRLSDLDRPLTQALRQHAETIWRRAGATPDRNPSALRMSREDLLLHVVTHMAAKHSDFRLIWLHDVARILAAPTAVDWEYVCATVTQLRLAGPMRAGLEAAARWVGAYVPLGRVRVLLNLSSRSATLLQRWEFRQLSRRADALATRDLRACGPGVWPPGAALGRLEGWGPQVRALRWLVIPSRDFMRRRDGRVESPVARWFRGRRLI